ncbi:beta-mannanase [Mariniflexile gromovii]|uniref:mannan endo-1,4-beta-mannosidase n=1 Tax=Mariniflexile gromovii TaxID=362523 RepID=A0ABS4BP35_9FLAO|nr:beta-mannanase [Mariniflexile gromovii]MBP0902359.1 beta-mannanase [Mariniflexile gromovii]
MFIKVEGHQFIKNNKPYHFIGTNFWYGAHLGAKQSGNRERLLNELDVLQAHGITNLRIMAGSEGADHLPYSIPISMQPDLGVYNEDILEGLDFLLVEMQKRNMHAVVCLSNFWYWSGGLSQYLSWVTGDPIPYPNDTNDWEKYMRFTAKFYANENAIKAYNKHVETIITRVNSISQMLYFEDETIMSWELANEPYAIQNQVEYLKWIETSSDFIKKLAPNQLLTIGGEGNTPFPLFTNNNALSDYKFESLDYITIHIWIQNWEWYNPKKHEKTYKNALKKAENYIKEHMTIANTLNKPVVLEEFGISRDHLDYTKQSSVNHRDVYFKDVFNILLESIKSESCFVGCNFWAWGGSGTVHTPGTVSNNNMEFIGDPSHEPQGWYSVFESDETTLQLIKMYNSEIIKLNQIDL